MPHKINCALSGHGKSKLPLLGVARLRMRGQTIAGKNIPGKAKDENLRGNGTAPYRLYRPGLFVD